MTDLVKSRPGDGLGMFSAFLTSTLAALVWGLQCEQARTLEDLLYRRTRAGLLNIKACNACERDLAEVFEQ